MNGLMMWLKQIKAGDFSGAQELAEVARQRRELKRRAKSPDEKFGDLTTSLRSTIQRPSRSH